MKKFYLTISIVPLFFLFAKGQQDCCTAPSLPGPVTITIPFVGGNGDPEPLNGCTCLATNEHDSYWFSFQCTSSGSFEMMITPIGLGADYDFALIAGQCPCNPGTQTISCDYTGPINPPGPFVPTGISSNPSGTFGVPGATEFQPTASLVAGTTYYIVADNITTNGVGFTIQFAGSAGIGPAPGGGPLPAPGTISGSTTACPGATLNYNVPVNPLFSSYNWTVNPPTVDINGTTNAVSVNWTDAGTYTLCAQGQTGCQDGPPSCITVTVAPIIAAPILDGICIGGEYTAPNGEVFTGPGVYDLVYTSYQGCDSIVPLILNSIPTSFTVLIKEICQGDCYIFNGETLCESGVYQADLTNYLGCDSTVQLNLIEIPNEAQISGDGAISCNGNPVILDGSGSIGSGNVTYSWTNQSGQVIGTTPVVQVVFPGNYTLTVQSQLGNTVCTDQATANVAADNTPPANVTATGGSITCAASSTILQGNSTSPGVSYAWTGPNGYSSALQNPTVSVTGTYTLTVTGQNGCTATATATVSGDSNLPNATATGGTLTCSTTSVALGGNSTTPGVSYAWAGPNGFTSNLQNPAVTSQGLYVLTVTAANGCSAQANATVNLDNAIPTVAASGGTLDCVSPNLFLQGSSTTPGVSYAWTGPNGFSSALQNPSVNAPGSYSLTVTAANGCSASTQVQVSQDANTPNVSASGGTLNCNQPTLILQGNSTTTGVSYAWTGPNGFSSTDPNPVVSSQGTYTLTVTAPNGCSASAPAVVMLDNALPDVSATGSTLTCTTGSTAISGNSTTPGVTYAWTGPGGFTSTLPNPTVSQAGTYVLTVTSANGCTNSANAIVQTDAGVPDVSATGGTLDCNVSSIQLMSNSATAGVTYAWTGPGGFVSAETDPVVSLSGNYTLVVTAQNNCTAQATAVVILDDVPPAFQPVGGSIDCNQKTVVLNPGTTASGLTYEWTGAGGFSSTQATPVVDAAGTYTLTVIGSNGCSASQTAVVIADMAEPAISADAGIITCSDTEAALDGNSTTPGTVFEWAGPGGFVANVSDTTTTLSGTYMLTVTGSNGCATTTSVVVSQDTQSPDVDATGGILSCDFPSIPLNGSSGTPGVTWSWTGPGGFTSLLQNPVINAAGIYALTVTATNGCTASDFASVGSDTDIPNAAATGGAFTCALPTVQLTGSSTTIGGVNYSWTGPNGFSSNQQNPSVGLVGTYILLVTAANGCTATASAQVTANTAAPNVTAAGGVLTCTAGSLALTGNSTTNGVNYAWTGPGGFTSNLQNPIVTAPGAYVLTVTAANGCTATATAQVNADSNTPNVSANGGSLTCIVTSLTLDGNSTTNGVNYNWSGPNGFTSNLPDPVVSAPGLYTLTVTAPNGCTNVADATVLADNNPPAAAATGGLITCQSPSVTLSGSSSASDVSYAWTGPNGFTSNQQNPVVGQGGVYLLTVTGANGCTATASADVQLDANVPVASAGGGTLTCVETQVQLSGSTNQPGVAWAWTGPGGFTSDEQNPVVSEAGTYLLTITNGAGCSATASTQVEEMTEEPSVLIEQPDELNCGNASVSLNASGSDQGPGFTFQWLTTGGNFANGQTTLTPEVDAAGVYTLAITNETNGCVAQESVTVELVGDAPTDALVVTTNSVCFNANDGVIAIEDVAGGTPPILYGLNNQPFTGNGVFTGLPPGVYEVTIQDAFGCEWKTTVALTEPPQLQVSLHAVDLAVDEALPLGDSTLLRAALTLPVSSLASVVWKPDGVAGGCEKCLELVVAPFETTTYEITVTDENGCTAKDEVTVPVNRQRPVFVPNAFSPNGDGLNDLLTIFGGKSVTNIKSFLVLSRWGETIFELYNFSPNEAANGWDGTHRGKTLDPAVFVWFAEVEFVDGESLIFEGDVTLLR